MITRIEYMASSADLHHAYYAQFVTPGLIALVKSHIGADRIKASTNKHFNDIPLNAWDRLYSVTPDYIPRKLWIECESSTHQDKHSFFWSKSSNVCVLKAAAQIIKDTP